MMLDANQIKKLFLELNDRLKTHGEVGEIGIVGGAVMCVVFQTRNATKDVDAIFAPTRLLRKLAADIGREHSIGEDWLNDGAMGFIQGKFEKCDFLNLSNLRVWSPEAQYMLAMKCMSARWDTNDQDDVIFLIKYLNLKRAAAVFLLIEMYYPKNIIPPKTQFFIEEIFEKIKLGTES